MRQAVLRFILFTILVASLCSCLSFRNAGIPDAKGNPDEVFKQGETLFAQKQYAKAVEVLERLKSAHPDFKKIPEVHLRIADSLFESKDYDKAVARYTQFIELYPLHKDIPRARYYIGLAYFNQIRNTDLDNSVVERAAQVFQSIANDTQAGEWTQKAKEKVTECRKKLGEKELYKARTYLSIKDYEAARVALVRVLGEYSGLGLDEEAKELLKKANKKLGLGDEPSAAQKTGNKE